MDLGSRLIQESAGDCKNCCGIGAILPCNFCAGVKWQRWMALNKSEYEPRPLGANVPKGRGSLLFTALFVTASEARSGGFGKAAGAGR